MENQIPLLLAKREFIVNKFLSISGKEYLAYKKPPSKKIFINYVLDKKTKVPKATGRRKRLEDGDRVVVTTSVDEKVDKSDPHSNICLFSVNLLRCQKKDPLNNAMLLWDCLHFIQSLELVDDEKKLHAFHAFIKTELELYSRTFDMLPNPMDKVINNTYKTPLIKQAFQEDKAVPEKQKKSENLMTKRISILPNIPSQETMIITPAGGEGNMSIPNNSEKGVCFERVSDSSIKESALNTEDENIWITTPSTDDQVTKLVRVVKTSRKKAGCVTEVNVEEASPASSQTYVSRSDTYTYSGSMSPKVARSWTSLTDLMDSSSARDGTHSQSQQSSSAQNLTKRSSIKWRTKNQNRRKNKKGGRKIPIKAKKCHNYPVERQRHIMSRVKLSAWGNFVPKHPFGGQTNYILKTFSFKSQYDTISHKCVCLNVQNEPPCGHLHGGYCVPMKLVSKQGPIRYKAGEDKQFKSSPFSIKDLFNQKVEAEKNMIRRSMKEIRRIAEYRAFEKELYRKFMNFWKNGVYPGVRNPCTAPKDESIDQHVSFLIYFISLKEKCDTEQASENLNVLKKIVDLLEKAKRFNKRGVQLDTDILKTTECDECSKTLVMKLKASLKANPGHSPMNTYCLELIRLSFKIWLQLVQCSRLRVFSSLVHIVKSLITLVTQCYAKIKPSKEELTFQDLVSLQEFMWNQITVYSQAYALTTCDQKDNKKFNDYVSKWIGLVHVICDLFSEVYFQEDLCSKSYLCQVIHNMKGLESIMIRVGDLAGIDFKECLEGLSTSRSQLLEMLLSKKNEKSEDINSEEQALTFRSMKDMMRKAYGHLYSYDNLDAISIRSDSITKTRSSLITLTRFDSSHQEFQFALRDDWSELLDMRKINEMENEVARRMKIIATLKMELKEKEELFDSKEGKVHCPNLTYMEKQAYQIWLITQFAFTIDFWCEYLYQMGKLNFGSKPGFELRREHKRYHEMTPFEKKNEIQKMVTLTKKLGMEEERLIKIQSTYLDSLTKKLYTCQTPPEIADYLEKMIGGMNEDSRDKFKAQLQKYRSILSPFCFLFHSLKPDGSFETCPKCAKKLRIK